MPPKSNVVDNEWLARLLGQNYSRTGKIESYSEWKKILEDLDARRIMEDENKKSEQIE